MNKPLLKDRPMTQEELETWGHYTCAEEPMPPKGDARSPVTEALARLDKAITILAGHRQDLQMRLDSVLTPDTPDPGRPECPDDVSQSVAPLVRDIENLTDAIVNESIAIQHITNRLAV